jgi:hypothetical protein
MRDGSGNGGGAGDDFTLLRRERAPAVERGVQYQEAHKPLCAHYVIF